MAEGITRRFFNVIQLLSQSIPIIAIQANVVEVEGQRALRFTTVLDVYEEEEEPGVTENADYEATWRKDHPLVVEAATILLDTVRPIIEPANLRFHRDYVGISAGRYDYFWFPPPKGGGNVRFGVKFSSEFLKKGTDALDQAGILYHRVGNKGSLHATVNKSILESKADTFRILADLARSSQPTA